MYVFNNEDFVIYKKLKIIINFHNRFAIELSLLYSPVGAADSRH